MNIKIENRLNNQDLVKLADSLRDESVDSVELVPMIDYGFLKVSSLVVSRCNKGYSITSCMLFDDPIGNTVCVHIGIEESGLRKSSKKIELDLRKPLICGNEIARDIAYSLSLIEGVVNYACMIRDEQRFDIFVVDSKLIARQISESKRERKRRTLEGKRLNRLRLFMPTVVLIYVSNPTISFHYTKNTIDGTCMVGRRLIVCFRGVLP